MPQKKINVVGSFFSNKFSFIIISVTSVPNLNRQGGVRGESRMFLNLAIQNSRGTFQGLKIILNHLKSL